MKLYTRTNWISPRKNSLPYIIERSSINGIGNILAVRYHMILTRIYEQQWEPLFMFLNTQLWFLLEMIWTHNVVLDLEQKLIGRCKFPGVIRSERRNKIGKGKIRWERSKVGKEEIRKGRKVGRVSGGVSERQYC